MFSLVERCPQEGCQRFGRSAVYFSQSSAVFGDTYFNPANPAGDDRWHILHQRQSIGRDIDRVRRCFHRPSSRRVTLLKIWECNGTTSQNS